MSRSRFISNRDMSLMVHTLKALPKQAAAESTANSSDTGKRSAAAPPWREAGIEKKYSVTNKMENMASPVTESRSSGKIARGMVAAMRKR